MLFPRKTQGWLYRKRATRDIHGQEQFDAPERMWCSVVRLADSTEASPVRADSAASRGSAEQEVLQAKLLVTINTKVVKGDVVKLMGRVVEITSIHQRNDINGFPHHLELGGAIKSDM